MLEVIEMGKTPKTSQTNLMPKAQSLYHKQLCATTLSSFLHSDRNVEGAQETFVQC